MYKCAAIIFSLFCLTGCIRFYSTTPVIEEDPIPSVPVAPIADVVLRYATELKHEHELNLCDSRIYYDDTLRRICLQFESQSIGELCNARMLIVEIVETLLQRLNASSEARNLTLKRHFDYFDLTISIHFTSYFIEYVDQMYIAWVTLQDGITTFYAGDVFMFRLDRWHARSEEYYKSLLFATIMRDSEKHYKETHPKSADEKPNFGRGYVSPTDWFSK